MNKILRVIITLQQLKYFTQIHVRSTRGRNARGRKITGIECLPGEDKVRERTNKKKTVVDTCMVHLHASGMLNWGGGRGCSYSSS